DKYLLILILSNISIIYGTEYIYIIDSFNNRMNTIFKFYFVGYIILNLISFYIIYKFITKYLSIKKSLLIFITFLIITPSLWWTVAAIKTRSVENQGIYSINGLNYLSPDEKEAISFIRNNIETDKIILEGVGKSYTKSNLFSSATGRSTVLAWVNHQIQWRNDVSTIIELSNKIEHFYNNPNINDQILNEYNISYIIYSDYEKLRYENSNKSDFNEFNLIFANNKINIYSIK
ncbi:MAG: hypothetical protein GWO78_02385, partial [Dehalococcoidales bacterium]|nr:hypothetical protein [Dehalococcoidales bacterium]